MDIPNLIYIIIFWGLCDVAYFIRKKYFAIEKRVLNFLFSVISFIIICILSIWLYRGLLCFFHIVSFVFIV